MYISHERHTYKRERKRVTVRDEQTESERDTHAYTHEKEKSNRHTCKRGRERELRETHSKA